MKEREKMIKLIKKIGVVFVAMLFLTGCRYSIEEIKTLADEECPDRVSGGISNSFYVIDDIAIYISGRKIIVKNISSGEERIDQVAEEFLLCEVAGSEKYFYIMAEGDMRKPHLWVYDKTGKMIEDRETSFKRIGARNGIIFALYDEQAFCIPWRSSSDKVDRQDISYIEATHYMSEEKFIEEMPTDLTGWTEIKGENPTIEGQKFIRETETEQWYHYVPYYLSEKINPIMKKIGYEKYVGGNSLVKSRTDEEAFNKEYLPKLQKVMKEYTGCFILEFIQIDNKLYGVCRIYGDNKFLNTCTQNFLYSITLEYDQETDSFVKQDEFEGKEIIYYDKDWIVYYNLEGLYYMDTDTRTEHLLHKREKEQPSDDKYLDFCVGIKNNYILYEVEDKIYIEKLKK